MKTYDIFGLSQLIEKGLARKLELVENAVNQLDPALEPITVLDSFVFAANTNNGQTYRLNYEVNEGYVKFSNPVAFMVESNTTKFDRASKKIVRSIVEALADNNDAEVEFFKAQWLGNQRQKKLLESRLDLNVGTHSKYITNAKKVVSEAISNVRGAKSLLRKGTFTSNWGKLVSERSIVIAEKNPVKIDEERSRRQLIYSKILEARQAAKDLGNSPVFRDYVTNLYNGIDEREAIAFIAENYQELFCLSISEQTEVLYNICERELEGKPELAKIVECIMGIGHYAVSNPEIARDLSDLSDLVGANSNNFHSRMNLIEDEMNARSFSLNDLKILQSVLESIVTQPSEFLAPEFVVEARRALRRLVSMVESGNIDDAVVSATIHLVSQFYPQTMTLGESEEQDAYQKFFQSKLEKFGVKSPDELSDEKKKEFFNEIEKEWKGDKEESKNESIDAQTGFPKGILRRIVEGKNKRKVKSKSKSKGKGKRKEFPPAKEDGDKKFVEFKKKKGKSDAPENFQEVAAEYKRRKGKNTYEELQDFKNRLGSCKKSRKDAEACADLEDEIDTEMLTA